MVKQALLIGINYRGTSSELRGCIHDVEHMRQYLVESSYTDFVIITDDTEKKPTRAVLQEELTKFVNSSHTGDNLFLHYSGHGSSVRDRSGDEADGFDEAIVPLDYQTAGMIIDDDLHVMLVKNLPAGVKLM